MKIKRFDNIWIMGLILSGTILVVLYIVKLLFPSFIIETAQNEKICLIGNYIDTHEWAWFLSSTVLKEAVRIMLDYKAVNYDMAYVLYGQKFLHDKFEKRLKDGFKIEMC